MKQKSKVSVKPSKGSSLQKKQNQKPWAKQQSSAAKRKVAA